MSGVLNRQLTMDDSQRGQGDAGGRQLGNGHSQGSALQFFGQAKKRINDIFKEIGEYIVETDKFVDDVVLSGQDIISQECCRVVKGFSQRVNGIMEILARDRMKVAFFGRTSNGKSTVINAMLRDKIMPSGIGHTTHCFIQVEGTDSSEGFLLTEGSDQPQSIGSIKQLAHNLSSVKLEENSLVRILWPKSKCRLLKEDVVFVDSPGIDVTQELDSWIDKYCLDADVFVLVGNAESTLMQTEKNFFHKVSERLSKPNIFILQNRWDVSVLEEDADDVRKQHSDRNLQFLIDELKVVDKKEAEDRLYFISAREALVSRLHEDKGTPTPTGSLQEGFHMRMFEFANFERKFEECISKSAVQTKFEQHTARGKNITSEVRGVMENTYIRSLELTEEQLSVRRGKNDELDYLGKQLKLLTQEVKDKIRSMVEDVERKVASALNDEIRRLSLLVEDFDRPFHPDNLLLNVYKKELHVYVEQCLCQNLGGRCTGNITKKLDCAEFFMAERLSALLPNETRQHLFNQIPKRDFEIAYRLDCRNLCAEFREDIEFRFSFGPAALMQKLMGSKSARSALLGATSSISQPPANRAAGDAPGFTEHDNEVLASILSTFASLTSRSSLGTVAVAGVLAKAAGWRVIAVTGALYGLLYLYERLTWTTKAKERAFKQQYVEYASSKLRLIVDLTSSNCSHQVQQELSSTFARLCHQADISKNQLKEEIKMLDLVIEKLKETTNKAKTLRNKADWLDTELNSFTSSYLTDST
ncbi:mitofusin-2 isoform X2 [Patella vulgata]|uniref:mitofusin-2 isoform X2 n=1 Tax=Patella vulgata TaxID=6465 RepID=UPI0024A8580A|nr:mitofusin-2 isoform X2 [Patella vulgata]